MKALSVVLSLVLAFTMTVSLTGCSSQQTAASLLNAAGPAVAAVVMALPTPDAALAAKLKTDFAAASAAVLAYKSGTACQEVVNVLNVVIGDIGLVSQIPGAAQYAALILVAADAVEAIVAAFPSCAPAAGAKLAQPGAAKMVKMQMTATQFKSRWNAEVKKHPELVAHGALVK